MPYNPEKKRCKAKSKSTGKQCGNYVSPGKTVCRIHGGASNGAPKGSKNALKTGQYETIFPDSLSIEEQERMFSMNTDALTVIDEEIRLTRIRETRILQRIAKAREAEENVGKPTGRQVEGKDVLHPAMLPVASAVTTSSEGNSKTLHSEAHSAYILKLENALTGVQLQLARLIDQKARLVAIADIDKGEAKNSGVLLVPGILSGDAWAEAARQVAEKKKAAEDANP